MDDDQRKKLLIQLRSHAVDFRKNGSTTDLGSILYFFLHDDEFWLRYVNDIGRMGTYSLALLQSLPESIDTMPANLRERILARIGELYPSAGKEGIRALPAKRALDALLRSVLPIENFFPSGVSEPKEVRAAYDAYLGAMKSIFGNSRDIGNYGLDEVLAVCREI